jgi:type I restriction enzyme S subunit
MLDVLDEERSVLKEHWLLRGGSQNPLVVRDEARWIGPVPQDWETIPARYLLREVTRHDLLATDPKLSLSMRFGVVRSDQLATRSSTSASKMKFKRCEPGDIVLNKYRAYLGAFAVAHERGLITPNYTVLAPSRPARSEYFAGLFSTPTYQSKWREMSYGVGDGMMPLYTTNFYRVRVLLPPSHRIDEVLRSFNGAVQKLDDARKAVSGEIDLLREFRIRLVADVVTGRKDVHKEAERLPDVDPAEVAALRFETASEAVDEAVQDAD